MMIIFMAEMYDNKKHVEDTFTESNLSEYLIQAQWAEFIELKKAITNLKIGKKTNVKLLDAVNLKRLNKEYDLIISTWFTVGNFYPFDFDFKNFKHGQDMSKNDKIETIFKQAYDMLKSNGEIIMGSVYIDNDETRKKQEDS